MAEDEKVNIESKLNALNEEFRKLTLNFPCEKCDLTFETINKLNEHLREMHIENILTNENFPCGLCDLVFENNSKRLEHTQVQK